MTATTGSVLPVAESGLGRTASRWGRAAAARRRCDEARSSVNGAEHIDVKSPTATADIGVGSSSSPSPIKASFRSDANVATAAVRCPICLDDVAFGDDACLPCGHGACAACVAMLLASRVDEGRVSAEDLSCPQPACRMPVPPHDIARLLREHHPEGTEAGARLYDRLLDFQARRFVPDPGEGERLVTCPTAGCGKMLIESAFVEEAKEVRCPVCSCNFCAGCGEPAHSGLTCEAAELERMDPQLKKLLAKQNWKRCPACRSVCERESGCNFMTCPSEQCQGKTHFCYICSELLSASDHAAHFEGFEGAMGRVGPFGSICVNHREVNLDLPSRPHPPKLSVVTGEDEGTIALRVAWGDHDSEPPTIYYRLKFTVPGSNEVVRINARAGDAYFDVFPRRLPKYRRYLAEVTPVNVNGMGPTSEASEEIHFHERELRAAAAVAAAPVPRQPKRWTAR